MVDSKETKKTDKLEAPFSGKIINCVTRIPYNITKVINKKGIEIHDSFEESVSNGLYNNGHDNDNFNTNDNKKYESDQEYSVADQIEDIATKLANERAQPGFKSKDSKENFIEWKIDPVSGNSVLYSSLKCIDKMFGEGEGKKIISKSGNVQEIIVGWTGEINNQEKYHYQEENGTEASTGALPATSPSAEEGDAEEERNDHSETKDKSDNSNNDNNQTTLNDEEQELEEAFKLSTTGDINMLNNTEDPLFLTEENKKYLTEELNNNDDENITIEPVWLLRKDQAKWRKYAENILWPDFHYILSPIQDSSNVENDWWFDYVKFNEAYAMKIAKIYKPGDIIVIHDYYLMLLPQLLRMRLKASEDDSDAAKKIHCSIGYFHHVTFPSFEYFRCLKYRKQLIDGVLGADVVFFQNYSFQRHFVSCCKRLLDCTATKDQETNDHHVSAYGADILIKTMPIGIDKDKLLSEAFNPEIDLKVETLQKAYAGKKILFGRDRLDSVRGVLQKLQSFDIFLEMFPQWRDKVVLIQVSSPTELHGSDGNKLERQVMELVNSINTKYGSLNFAPVQHYHMRIPKDVYLSLLRVADLCLVCSIRDSVNLTALEFTTVQAHQSENTTSIKPLILSEFSGTPLNKEDCYIINPWDSVAVAKTIDTALSRVNFTTTVSVAQTASKVPDIYDWSNKLLSLLDGFLSSTISMTPALNRPLLYKIYQKTERRMFLFDYDGTLTPIVQDPAAAIPTAKLYNLLNALAQDPKNEIWIISGRDQAFLNKWIGSKVSQIGLSAEHGCFIKGSNSTKWINLTEEYDMSWQKVCSDLMEHYTSKTVGAFVERKKVALTWHYRRAVPELGEFNAKELKQKLEESFAGTDLEVMEGKMNLEVRPKFVNKGEIVKRLFLSKYGGEIDMLHGDNSLEHLKQEELPDFVLCLGDDKTDEDMFNTLNDIESDIVKDKSRFTKNSYGSFGIYPVSVGSANKKTVAKAHLTDPQQVLETLGLLVGHVSLFASAGSVDLDDRGHEQK